VEQTLYDKIIESFIRLYQTYDIRSEKLFEFLQNYYGNHQQDYKSFDQLLAGLSQKESPILAELFKTIPLDQGKNFQAIYTAFNLVKLFGNVKPFAMDAVLAGEFDLWKTYGINPQPLYNCYSPQEAKKQAARFLLGDIEKFRLSQLAKDFFDSLVTIRNKSLLGEQTVASFAYLKFRANIKTSELEAFETALSNKTQIWQALQINQAIKKTISILGRRFEELPDRNPKRQQVLEMIARMITYRIQCSLYLMFIKYPQIGKNGDIIYNIFADEIMQLISNTYADVFRKYKTLKSYFQYEEFLKNDGIEFAYFPQDDQYIYSGDHYGECTASTVKKQVDPNVANIHWTVYSWILNPYYRVIDVFYQGEKLLKGHILPLIIHNRKILMIDAIEVVPKLRKRVRGKDNKYFDPELFNLRKDLLQKLFDKCENLAQEMLVDAIYVEMFSNADWVNQEITELPGDSYHVDTVIVPFGNEVIARNIEKLQGYPPEDVIFEVQAKNHGLMDQQMKRGYKATGVLTGQRKNWNIYVKGI
jgi:hypothetical protein